MNLLTSRETFCAPVCLFNTEDLDCFEFSSKITQPVNFMGLFPCPKLRFPSLCFCKKLAVVRRVP